MKSFLFVFSLLFIAYPTLLAQNLVMNHSFEEYVPDSINNCVGNGCMSKAKHWVNVGPGTSDYYHSDYNQFSGGRVPRNGNGTQPAHTGNAYAGIYAFEISSPVNVREYIRTHLLSPLVAGKTYTISFYASLGDSSNFAAGFGANISAVLENNFNGYLMLAAEHIHTPGTITDKLNWTFVTGTYQALGGEQYLTIGGFFDDTHSNTDTMTIGGPYPNAYYYVDDIFVGLEEANGIDSPESPGFTISPNPFSTQTTLSSSISFKNTDMVIYNSVGKVMKRIDNFCGQEITLDRSNLPSGLYFIHVTQNNQTVAVSKVVVK